VEQRGISVEDFDRRKKQSFWDGIASEVSSWDALIEDFNAQVASDTNT
jgi:hypothetical protein